MVPRAASRPRRWLGKRREYAPRAGYVTGLDALPLGRVVNDAKVTTTTRSSRPGEHNLDKMSDDDKRVYDMVVRRFLAVFHPDAVFENTRIVTDGAEHVPHPRARAGRGRLARRLRRGFEDRSGADGRRGHGPAAAQARPGRGRQRRSRTRPRGEADQAAAALLRRVAALGDGVGRRTIDDEELREAMKDGGLGTPATRAETIEKLIDVGYVERMGARALHREGPAGDRAAGGDALDLAGADRPVGAPARTRSSAARRRASLHGRHRRVRRHRHRPRRSTRSSRRSASRGPTSGPARSATMTSTRTARGAPPGRARSPAAAS